MRFPHALIAIGLFAACDTFPEFSQTDSALNGATTCTVSGATPDDGLDDLAAIQAALDNQGCAHLGPGVYNIFSPNPRNPAHPQDIILVDTGRSFRGAGPATTLKFSGDTLHAAWFGVGVKNANTEVAHLTLDTAQLTNTDEQTHAIQVTGPASKVSIHHMWFYHPQRTGMAGGDCIKVVGYDGGQEVNLAVTDNHFALCDRSGLMVHGATYGMVASGNMFYSTGDQDIDIESGVRNSDWTITNNTMIRPVAGLSVAINADLTERVTFTGNVIYNGRVMTYNVRNLVFANNTIASGADIGPVLYMVKLSEGINISGNYLEKTSTTDNSNVIFISHLGTGNPKDVTITGNTLKSFAPTATPIAVSNALSVNLTGNLLDWNPLVAPTINSQAVNVAGVTRRTESFVVSGNTFRSPGKWVVGTSNVGNISITGNTSTPTVGAPTWGYKCQPGDGPIVSTGNNWPAPNCTVTITPGI